MDLKKIAPDQRHSGVSVGLIRHPIKLFFAVTAQIGTLEM